jgi:hypothetical protein
MNVMRLLMIIVLGVLFVGTVMLPPAQAHIAAATDIADHLKLTGVVTRIQGDLIFAKTPWGQLTVGTTKRLGNIQVGDRITIWLNEDNSVIDVHKDGESTIQHSLLSGHLLYTMPLKTKSSSGRQKAEKPSPSLSPPSPSLTPSRKVLR